ncbi:MAG: enoyl-CoA hydratase/isomerase family protein [Phycisphaeraceae bacterium]|nr:enoyl-CoA hydratase/isomerase family protein [Phycisphaerales bacterium]MCB9861581.1 enoyl-CoA hydratase/isomerase family protein [Phycisphaeraceae bacterium]
MPVEPFALHTDKECPFAGIVTLTLEQPGKPVVVLDHDLIRRIEATIKQVPTDARGFVLASAAPRAFIAGADLNAIQQMNDEQLHAYLQYASRVFGMISQLPCPTVAAINGAVLGGGMEIAMHCDALVAAPPPERDSAPGKPYPVGLPESGLSICPGWGGTNLLPARMDPASAIELTASGKPLNFATACEAGVFDAVASDATTLLMTAKQWIIDNPKAPARDGTPSRWIGRSQYRAKTLTALDAVRASLPDTGSAKAVADAVDVGIAQGWEAALKCEQDHLVRLRSSPEGKAAIEAFFARSKA